MTNKILKYNKNKHQFNLNISGRHFVYRNTREEEIKEIDDWLINDEPIENRADITFEDNNGKLHEKVAIKTSGLECWFTDDKNGNADWTTFMWEIPTKQGTIYIHAKSGKVMYANSDAIFNTYNDAVEVKPDKVVINY